MARRGGRLGEVTKYAGQENCSAYNQALHFLYYGRDMAQAVGALGAKGIRRH